MYRRNKVRVNWHQELKNDEFSKEFGFKKRLRKQSELWMYDLSWYDYPGRCVERSWKKHRKTQYK
ncbi:hypothetical protein [Vibrio phage VCPH]|nr:hypothetical protein [Vibrio phage VCPH]